MPAVDEAEHAVLTITAGDWNEQQTADWLRTHLTAPPKR
jgi:hypothetical protein